MLKLSENINLSFHQKVKVIKKKINIRLKIYFKNLYKNFFNKEKLHFLKIILKSNKLF